jgi:hypothetical protein
VRPGLPLCLGPVAEPTVASSLYSRTRKQLLRSAVRGILISETTALVAPSIERPRDPLHSQVLIAQGATLHEVKEILGHSQIALTATLYGHAYLAAKREVVARVDAMLNPGSSFEAVDRD